MQEVVSVDSYIDSVIGSTVSGKEISDVTGDNRTAVLGCCPNQMFTVRKAVRDIRWKVDHFAFNTQCTNPPPPFFFQHIENNISTMYNFFLGHMEVLSDLEANKA